MSMKRPRAGRSKTSMDTLVRPPPAERSAGKDAEGSSVRAAKVEEQLGETRPIVTMSSPLKPSAAEMEPSGWFLERCYSCKKEIMKNKDVYMYSYLQAFCSVECRERQMIMDNVIIPKAAKKGGN